MSNNAGDADNSNCDAIVEQLRLGQEQTVCDVDASARFLNSVAKRLVDAWHSGQNGTVPVMRFIQATELAKIGRVALDDDDDDSDDTDDAFAAALKRVEIGIEYSLHSSHPAYMNQLWGGIDAFSLAGAWLTEALNTSQFTYEVAPLFSLVEAEVLQYTWKRLVGFDSGDGIFCPGGSMSNMYALNLARHRFFTQRGADVKRRGIVECSGGRPLVFFASHESHYSLQKGASLLGIGSDYVIAIKTNQRGQMLTSVLREKIAEAREKDWLPFAVVATAGTTVLGAFDPIDELADVCQEAGLWLHVDAAYGGSFLCSEKHRGELAGISRVDSVAWNPHKLLGIPLQCSMFVTRHDGLLAEAHATSASYLFQPDKPYDTALDSGDKSTFCGRKVDAFKLWLSWKAHRTSGFGRLVDTAVAGAQYMARGARDRAPHFRMVLATLGEPKVLSQCTSACFWYIPPALLAAEKVLESDDFQRLLGKVAPLIKKRMMYAGTLMVAYQPLGWFGLPNFFRVTTHCIPPPTVESMEFVLDEIERLGCDITLEDIGGV